MRPLAVVGVVTLLISGYGLAQSVQGVVTGTVLDPSGSTLPKAGITLTNTGTNISQTEMSSDEGLFRFNLVPPGNYTLTVRAAGFTEKQIRDIEVRPSQVTQIPVTLSLAGSTQSIEVQAQETLVQTATAELATTVDAKLITQIPLLSRNVFDLAFMAPTVTQGMDLRPASGGARQSGTAYLLNGADNNNNFSEGMPNLEPALESVGEFSMLTNSMSAQYGRAGGVVISAVQVSGTNALHGVLYEFNRNRSLNASDFFQNRQGSDKPKYIRNQFGGRIGGPIIRNRTFYAFAYDRIDARTGSDLDAQVPTPAELSKLTAVAGPLAKKVLAAFPLKTSTALCPDQAANAPDSIGHIGCIHVFNPDLTKRNTFYGKIDHNFSQANRVAISVNFQRQNQNILYDGGAATSTPISGAYIENYHNLSLVDTHVFNPRIINEFTVAHNRHYSGNLATLNGSTNIPYPRIDIDGADYGMGFSIGASEGYNSTFAQDRWQVQDNLSLLFGRHTIKVGGSYQYGIVYRNWDLGSPGSYEFGTVFGSPFKAGPGGVLTNVDPVDDSNFQNDVPYYQEISVDPRTGASANAYRHYMMKDMGIFVQDDWKVTRALTLNLGLRWERYGAPTEANGIISQFTNLTCTSPTCVAAARVGPVPSMWKTNNTDFGPRFGFAYQLGQDQRTSLRGGFGMFYDRIFDNVWSNGAWNPPFYGLVDLDASAGDVIYYGVPSSLPASAFNGLPRVSVRTMDVAMHDTGVYNYSLALERQFAKDFLVRLTFQGNQGRHLPVLMNLNRYDGMRFRPGFADARPNALYTGFNYRANNVNSNYNSFISEFQKRMGAGLQYQISYTFSKLMDYGSDLFSGETTQGAYSQPYYFVSNTAIQLEKGAGAFDHTHAFKAAIVYELPFLKDQNKLAGKILGGWQVSTFYQGYSGHPLNIYNSRTRRAGDYVVNGIAENLGGDYNLDGVANDRPTFVGSVSRAYSGWSPADGIFTDNNRVGCGFAGAMSSAASIAACNKAFGVSSPSTLFVNPWGTGPRFGLLGRNVFRGPAFNGLDATLSKTFGVTERIKLQLRGDALNLLNHPNFDGIVTDLNSSQFGRAQILIGSAPARRLQFGARIEF